MKGLLIKDFLLLKNNKQFFVMIILLGGAFIFAWNNPDFALSYVSILFTMFTISTIQYDEYDNGMAYLFSLPITRKGYVVEKYMFSVITAMISLGGMSVLVWISAAVKHTDYSVEEWAGAICASIFVIIIVLAFMIPMRLKYEGDKSRIALFILFGSSALFAYAVVKAAHVFGVNVEEIMENLITVNTGKLTAGCGMTGVVLMMLSYQISVKILMKKEF